MLATLGRGGRKGGNLYAGYYLEVGHNQSALSGGWDLPEKAALNLLRRHFLENTEEARRLKEIVSSKEFVDMFGEPREKSEAKKGKKGKEEVVRQNLWGKSDELKKAPKGVSPDNPAIEWLKLKSFWAEKK